MIEWRDVPEWEGLYRINSSGEVYSIVSHRVISQYVAQGQKYARVGLYRNGKRKTYTAHKLVARAFLEQNGLPVVRHLDGNAANNEVSNLAWGTISDNQRDSVAHGTQRMSRKTHCKNNHAFTPENTRIQKRTRGNERVCRQCAKEKSKAYKQKGGKRG